MDNHYHLVLDATIANLSRGMHLLNGLPARTFNDRHAHVGHVFQSRFHAMAIGTEEHLWEACRYVLMNPVRAGLCDQPSEWRWAHSSALTVP